MARLHDAALTELRISNLESELAYVIKKHRALQEWASFHVHRVANPLWLQYELRDLLNKMVEIKRELELIDKCELKL